jgi:hypothetical protein
MCSQSQFVPSAQQREVARQHVVFELRMFKEVAHQHLAALGERPQDTPAMCRVSALRDSALLHLRNLHDFFMVPRKKDDIIAADFVAPEHSDWTAAPLLAAVAEAVEDINKFRSHLTYTRTQRTRSWPLDVFEREIDLAFTESLLRLPDDERQTWRVMIDSPGWRPARQQRGFVVPETS